MERPGPASSIRLNDWGLCNYVIYSAVAGWTAFFKCLERKWVTHWILKYKISRPEKYRVYHFDLHDDCVLKEILSLFHKIYCALIFNQVILIYGAIHHVSTNKSILRFVYLFIEKIVDTVYIVIERLLHTCNTIFAACCNEKKGYITRGIA